jgi:hypothetical protein
LLPTKAERLKVLKQSVLAFIHYALRPGIAGPELAFPYGINWPIIETINYTVHLHAGVSPRHTDIAFTFIAVHARSPEIFEVSGL